MLNKNQQELNECSFHNWHETFSKNSIKAFCLPIPANVLEFLRADLFILPKECVVSSAGSSADNFVGEESNFDEDDTESVEAPEFPEFSKAIVDAINKLGGSTFIKTNWHSPKDAIWITAGQTLKAFDLTDVYQLLKASSIIKEDLNLVNENKSHHLILKKWKDIHPGTEFRCFVKNRNLIAISPRDWPHYHEHFKSQKQDIIKDIVSLFKEKIKQRFPVDNYCFDVVRNTKDHVTIVDFSPFNEKFTDSLAFEWLKLQEDDIIRTVDDDPDDPEFRYIASEIGIQPTSRNNYGIPADIINIFKASNPSAELTEEQLENMNRLVISQMQDELQERNDELHDN